MQNENGGFRPLRRIKKQLTNDECIGLLSRQTRGVLSVNGDNGYPYGMPMNHFYNAEDGCIYFHCGIGGHRQDAVTRSDKVSFCVYDEGYRNDGEWALNVQCVIVFGRIEIIDDIAAVTRIADGLCRKFTDDEQYIKTEIKNHAAHTLLLKLVPEHISGKRVRED